MRRTLRFQLIFPTLLIVLSVFTLYSVFTVQYGLRLFREQLVKDYQNTLDKTAQSIAYIQDDIQQFAGVMLVDEELASLLRRPPDGEAERIQQFYGICRRLRRYKLQKDYIFNIYLEDVGGTFFSGSLSEITASGYDFSAEWAERFRTQKTPRGFSGRHTAEITNRKSEVVTFAAPIFDPGDGAQRLGTLYINVSFSVFTSMLEGSGAAFAHLLLLAPDGDSLYDSAPGGDAPAASPFRIASGGMRDGWHLEAVVPQDAIHQALRDVVRLYAVLAVCCAVAVAGVLIPFITSLTSPLTAMMRATRQLSLGRLDVRIHTRARNELRSLADSFNDMTEKLRRYISKLVEDEKIQSDLKSDLLMAQINPHFLYNTLNSVIYLSMEGKNEEVVRFTRTLIRLLQDNLKFGPEGFESTVGEEIDATKAYLQLQAIRYPDRFTFDMQADEAAARAVIPRMLLQPLVENALFHGLLPLDRPGTIRVAARRTADGVALTVSDDGVGMDGATREALLTQKYDRSDPAPQMRPIGVSNIQERLKLFYPGRHEFSIETAPGRGSTVRILLKTEESK